MSTTTLTSRPGATHVSLERAPWLSPPSADEPPERILRPPSLITHLQPTLAYPSYMKKHIARRNR